MRGRRVRGTASENELTLSKSVELMFRAFYVPPINAAQRSLFLPRAGATARRAWNYDEEDVISSWEPRQRHFGASTRATPFCLGLTAARVHRVRMPDDRQENSWLASAPRSG